MAQVVTYSINDETLDNIALIMKTRPELTRSFLVRELIAAEAERIRQKLQDIEAETKQVRDALRSVREKLTA